MEADDVTRFFLENIERHLKAKGWDRTQFAEKLGVKLPHVSRMLSDTKLRAPSVATLAKLGELFGVEPCVLLCPAKGKMK